MKLKSFFVFIVIVLILGLFSCKDSSNPLIPDETNEIPIGTLSLNLPGTIANTSTKVNVSVTIKSEVVPRDSVLILHSVDESGSIIEQIGTLYDDGRLIHNDDIMGDNIFNMVLTILESKEKLLRLRCSGKFEINGNITEELTDIVEFRIYSDISQDEISQIHSTQNDGVVKLQEFYEANGGNHEESVNQLVTWLLNKSYIDSVQTDGVRSIGIKYKSGLSGCIIISEVDENGKLITKGGISDTTLIRKTSTALRDQTTGKNSEYVTFLKKKTFTTANLKPNLIGNKKVLIYSPFQHQFSLDHGPSITSILEKSELDFEITLLENQQANISALNNITDYGLVLISTHGTTIPHHMFATGEIADTNANKISSFHKTLLRSGQLSLMTQSQKNLLGFNKYKHDFWAITSLYIGIHTLSRRFPNSIIINASCQSNLKRDFSRVFLNSGAKAYFGFSGDVTCSFAVEVIDTLVNRLANGLKTIDESFIPDQKDPKITFTKFEMETNHPELHYPLELINGDFEFGVLDGWNKSGDGRNITKLGNLYPYEGSFMGIISTGLGNTVATGSISQTIKIEENQKLKLRWNFLSEELLEFIGTSFQDYFQVAIKTKDGTNNLILVKTVDDIAQNFGASKNPLNAGKLISVTPPIDFGNHGVYMTDWQTFTYDLNSYKDKIVTLVLAVGDVGDSSYDTAVLLDEIIID